MTALTRKKTALRTLVILERHRTGWPMITTCLAAAAAASIMMAATSAHAGSVYAAKQQIGDYGADRHLYTIIDDGQMFRESGDAPTGQANWRDLVFVEIRRPTGEPTGRQPRDGDTLVMSERMRPVSHADVTVPGGGAGGVDNGGSVSPVPIPGAVWLFASALGLLAGRRLVKEMRL